MSEKEISAIARENGDAPENDLPDPAESTATVRNDEGISDIDDIDDIPDIPDYMDDEDFSDEPDPADYTYEADDEPIDDVDLYRDLSVKKAVHSAAKGEQIAPAPQEQRPIREEQQAVVTETIPPVHPVSKEAAEAPSELHEKLPEYTGEDDTGREPLHITDVEVTGSNQIKVNKIYMLNTVISMVTLCVIAASIFTGYAYIKNLENDLGISKNRINMLENKAVAEESTENNEADDEEGGKAIDAISLIDEEEVNEPKAPVDDNIELDRGKILIYDSYVGYGWVPVLSGVKTNEYRQEDFSVDDNYRMKYVKDGELSSYFGIDVSSFQGDINWDAARSDGVEFAILRIGVRGYGEEGNIKPDEKFDQNYEDAHDAGVDLGAYFYSQAISVEEAVEEAKFVLERLDGRPLEYPVVFDWEPVDPATAEGTPRTEDVMPGTLTLGAIAFCETIKDAGYDAMIYTNKKMAYIKYDMRKLADYPVWLALYSTDMTYYYDFDIWQYGYGTVDGIEGDVDLDIAIIR